MSDPSMRHALIFISLAIVCFQPHQCWAQDNLPPAVATAIADIDNWEVGDRDLVLASLGEIDDQDRGLWEAEQGKAFASELIALEGLVFPEGIELSWVTSREFGTDRFAVERQLSDGRFATIGMVEAQGRSDQLQVYRFLDRARDQVPQVYRLRQIDQSGDQHLSQPLQVIPAAEGLARLDIRAEGGVIPMPNQMGVFAMMMWDQNGELVFSIQEVAPGEAIELPEELRTGTYIVRLETRSGVRNATLDLP